MAKLPEVAAVIGETLRVNAKDLKAHIAGLRAAGRFDGNFAGPEEAADLLCACLSTDQDNATGPCHLPFVGGLLLDEIAKGPGALITPGSEPFALLEIAFPTLGEALSGLITFIGRGDVPAGCVTEISVSGAGDRLRAYMVYDAPCSTGRRKTLVVFGYLPIGDLFEKVARRPARIELTHTVGGEAIDAIAELMVGLPPDLPEQSHLTEMRVH